MAEKDIFSMNRSKTVVFVSLMCILLCLIISFISCERDPVHTADAPDAKTLISGVLQAGGFSSPELVFGFKDPEYSERFSSMYHADIAAVADGAFAISSGMSADEITVIRPKDAASASEFLDILDNHVKEEISVFEKYSPEDTAKLQNRQLFREGDFVILIVSDDCSSIRSSITYYINDPESLPKLSDTDGESTTSEPQTTVPPETKPDTTDEPATTEPETTGDPVVPSKSYSYENELPEREKAPDSFFEDAVFIGDSRLAGLMLYTAPKVAYDYTFTSLSVNSVFTRNLVETEGGKVTIADALKTCEFNKCYLMFGVNELGWKYASAFVADYRKVVEYVKEVNPDCDVYVMLMFPTTAEYSEDHDGANATISERNDMIAEMAKELDVYLINTADALCGEEFVLPDELSGDGVHGNRTACRTLRDYLLTHY